MKYKNLLSFRRSLKLFEKTLKFFEKTLVSPNLSLDFKFFVTEDFKPLKDIRIILKTKNIKEIKFAFLNLETKLIFLIIKFLFLYYYFLKLLLKLNVLLKSKQ